jgi:toxin FitB
VVLGSRRPGNLFAGRILPFDEEAGLVWARLMADGKRTGRPRNPLDMIVAATAEANHCIIVTDNEKDFAGLKLLNPV